MNRLPGLSEHEIDQEAILLRAYGKGTDVLIDRDRKLMILVLVKAIDSFRSLD